MDGASPVRVENAFSAIVSPEEFRRVARSMRSKAPARANPRLAPARYREGPRDRPASSSLSYDPRFRQVLVAVLLWRRGRASNEFSSAT